MNKRWRILLIIVALVCFGVAGSYPLRYYLEERSTEDTMEHLMELRSAGRERQGRRGERERIEAEQAEGAGEAEGTGEGGAEESEPRAESARPEGTAPSDMGEASEGAQLPAEAEPQEAEPSQESEPTGQESQAQGQVEQSQVSEPQSQDQAQPETETQPNQAAQGQESQAIQSQPSEAQGQESQASEANQVQPSIATQEPNQANQVQPSIATQEPNQANQVQPSVEFQKAGQTQPTTGTQQAEQAQTSVPPEQRSESVLPRPSAGPASVEVTAEPANTNAPGNVNAPEGTNAPESANVPEGTNIPQDANAPEVAITSIPTQTPEPTPTPVPTPTPTPAPTVNRFERDGAVPYDQKEKKTLDVSAILPEFREIYEENHDFAGWITIPGTIIDYPVVQTQDSEFYLHHDFYGKKNANGQIILDTKCDPYTPSYNLVISGHSMRSGKMFGRLVNYMYKSYWEEHKYVYFDTLMEERTYVVLAAFFSADYDVDEEGFRYNADIRYSLDARQWLREVRENELYDTGIEAEFGDEFLTLTTCNKAHRSDGRFVVICRRLREGEEIE